MQKQHTNLVVNKYAFITDDKFMFLPASNIQLGMNFPVLDCGKIIIDTVASVKRSQYSGYVYDLEIDKVHNYIASEVVVHNSIYSWRGADFRNILNFERDYPKVTVIKLEQNYRSTKPILDGAHTGITKTKQRSDKKLWTEKTVCQPITIVSVSTQRAE